MDKVLERRAEYGLKMNTEKMKLVIVSNEWISGAHLYINKI